MTAILTITHGDIGQAMLAEARSIVPTAPVELAAVSVSSDDNEREILDKIEQALNRLQQRDEVMLLCDLYAATPFNTAQKLAQEHGYSILSGLNLAMLLKAINYAYLPPCECGRKAQQGGQQGIVQKTIVPIELKHAETVRTDHQ